MCWLGFLTPSQSMPDVHIKASYSRNSDGFGIMIFKEVDGVKQPPIIKRGMMSLDEVRECFKEAEGHFTVFHFRKATLGAKTIDNVHPFPILTAEEDKTGRGGLWMLFNGTLNPLRNKLPNDMSDTAYFAAEMMRPLMMVKADRLSDPAFIKLLDDATGSVKTLFVWGNGEIVQINKTLWHTMKEGPVVSNTYSKASDAEVAAAERAARGETDPVETSIASIDTHFNGSNNATPGHPVVDEILRDSPAAASDIKVNDLVFRINDTVINSADQIRMICTANIDSEIEVTLFRDNQFVSTKITPKMSIAFSTVSKSKVQTTLGVVSSQKRVLPAASTIKSAAESAAVFEGAPI